MTSIECRPGGPVAGIIRVPGDKSISHRSIILASKVRVQGVGLHG